MTNKSAAIMSISSIAISGSAFSETDTCTAQLGPNSSCTITVVSSPTAAASVSGVLTIQDSDPSSPQIVNLTGSGEK